jgi:catalase
MKLALLFGAGTLGATSLTNAAPPKRTPGDLVDALHTAFGAHHARAVHTKGVLFEGTFVPDRAAASLTRARHLQGTASKATIRFSSFTGLPDIPDNAGPANPRGIAIRFTLPDGTFTDLVGHSFNGFPTATSDEFRDLLLAIAASGPTAAKPSALDQFLHAHPIAKTFLTTQKTPASFATISYFGVNAFAFTSSAGTVRYGRYQLVPVGGEQLLSAEAAAKQTASYLMDELPARVARGPVTFQLFAQIAEPGDKIDDPSIAWPASRRRIALGTLTITARGADTPEADKAFAVSPTNLIDGIAPADPMIGFRGEAYPISVRERR